LGIAQITLVEGATGFLVKGESDELNAKLSKVRERLAKSTSDLKAGCDEQCTQSLERRIRRLTTQVEDIQEEIRLADQGGLQPQHGIRNRIRPLNDKVDDHAVVNAMVQATKPRIEAAAAMSAPSKTPDAFAFVGDSACQSCHAEQHAQWKSTPHAYAWSTLQAVGRSQDLECWSCHVTGAHHDNGPQHPSQVAGLENVGCETCHGPGRNHTLGPSKANIIKDPGVENCIQCHDGVKDEGRFDADVYMSKVIH
jgi:hypothetical protein